MEIALIILLATGITWVELMRRKDKEILLSKISSLQHDLGMGEIKRDVDPSTQSEEQIVSEAINLDEEMRRITEEKLKYRKTVVQNSNSSSSEKDDSKGMKMTETEDDYDSAF